MKSDPSMDAALPDGGARGRDRLQIVGRSSSHFTRVVRIFAEELAVPYELKIVPSLLSTDAAAYGGNPGLRLPNLLIPNDPPVFGCLNSCRALAERSTRSLRILWPEGLTHPLPRNAQELTLQSMSTEVSLIMITTSGGGATTYAAKLRTALAEMLVWLNERIDDALEKLPARDLCFLEVSLFCLVEHLPFRNVLSVEQYTNLLRFRDRLALRPSLSATPFRFDS
jgi:glutathione S-transferase